ncbi:MAG: transporter substrate-binding domain-containing protein [Pseudomonas sp.]|uniref:substrate-binding periplasmic protein n=1 Tax=Pseudomonas sp. TaxID=306 RepID=UPI0033990729
MRLCRKGVALLVLLVGGLLTRGLLAAEPAKTLRLASLEWLPYVGAQLPAQGLSANTAGRLFEQFGKTLAVDYFPWKRAMQIGGSDPAYAGYFPAYYTDERARQCYFSQAMGHSTVGLAYLKQQPLVWHDLDDLAAVKLAVVLGYSNGEAFDQRVEQGQMNIEASVNDRLNLKKLLASRVRAVVIDKSVLRYLLISDHELNLQRESIEFHPQPLALLSLHVCFQRTAEGLEHQRRFDAALTQADLDRWESEYFQAWESSSPAAAGHPTPRP